MGRLEGEAGHGRCAWQHTAVPALTGLFKTRQPDNNSLAANDILQSARVATSEPLIVPVPSNGALFWRDWPGPMCKVAPREPALIELFKIRQPDNNSLAANDMLQRTRVATSEPLIVPVSSNGALFWRGWSRLIRVVAPRGARLPPLGLKLAGQTKPTLRPSSSTKSTRVAIRHRKSYPVALDSHAIAEIVISAPNQMSQNAINDNVPPLPTLQ